MRLEVDEIAARRVARRAEEMVEADFEQIGGRRVARDVAAQLAVCAVRADHHRERVPAQHRREALLELQVARVRRLLVDGDRVHVRRRARVRRREPAARRVLGELREQVLRALGARVRDDAVERVQPFGGFLRIGIVVAARGGEDRANSVR